MVERFEEYTFTAKDSPTYTLKVPHERGKPPLLFKDDLHIEKFKDDNGSEKDIHEATLKFLHYFVDSAGEEIKTDVIAQEIWPNSSNQINRVHGAVSTLRAVLDDRDKNKPRFIATLAKAYRFIPEVERKGYRLEGLASWDRDKFSELFKEVTARVRLTGKGDAKTGDIRLLVTLFSQGVPNLDLHSYLEKGEKGIHLKVMMFNPDNRPLIEARFKKSKDLLPAEAYRRIKKQIKQFKDIAKEFPNKIELRLTDLMPCGYVVLAKKKALLGIYLAHDTFTKGPMFFIPSHTTTWHELDEDWKIRWKEAEKHSVISLKETPEKKRAKT